MKLLLNSLPGDSATVGATAERISHPKDGALAQQPEAERAPHSAVERPEAAGKPRSTYSVPMLRTRVRRVHGVEGLAMMAASFPERLSLSLVGCTETYLPQLPSFDRRARWFEPTWRGWRDSRFLVQDRLRASDVLHRDWDWSAWL
jgi:hypothetical protein